MNARLLFLFVMSTFVIACNLSDGPPLLETNNEENNTPVNNLNNDNNEDCDECGNCGENKPECVQDCAGAWGGSAFVDMCGSCVTDASSACEEDCAGEWGGSNVVDMCGDCVSPQNTCGQDCAGEWGGESFLDMCNICVPDEESACEEDCNQQWGGTAEVDACGRCVGGSTGLTACPTITIAVAEDAHVMANAPRENFGSEPELIVDRENAFTYLLFDLTDMPDNSVIRSLSLRMTATSSESFGGNGETFLYFSSDVRWSQDDVTYEDRPTIADFVLASWNVAGIPEGEEREIVVTDAPELIERVQGRLWGDRLVTLRISSPGYLSTYASSEDPDASRHPTLEIGYQVLDTISLPAVANATVSQSEPNTNFGDSLDLIVDPRSSSSSDPPLTSFVTFDLSGVPEGTVIERVSLEMMAYMGWAYGGNGNVFTFLVDNPDWDESAITYNNQPTWQPERLGFWWIWYNNNPPGSVGTPDNKLGINASELLIEPARQAFANPEQLISFRLASSGYRTVYRSRHYAVEAERPRLVIYYAPD